MSDTAAVMAAQLRGFDRSLPMALLRARESVMSGFRASLGAHGVTEQQWRVLRALDHADRPMVVGELVDATLLLGPSLSRMLASMVDRGLVTRTTGRDDARRADVAITDAGRALVAEIAPESERWYAHIEHHLGADDLDELHRILGRLADLGPAGPRSPGGDASSKRSPGGDSSSKRSPGGDRVSTSARTSDQTSRREGTR